MEEATTEGTAKMPLTAEQRRERRMKKILENSESRMNRILSNGEDEGGKRLAPAMEGGECFNITNNSSTVAPIMCDSLGDELEFTQQEAFSNMQNRNSTTENPKKWINVSLLTVALGILARIIMLFSGPINIGILWTILYPTIVVRVSSTGLKQSTKSELNALIGAISKDPFLKKIVNIGFYFIEFIKTTITFVAAFLITHLIFEFNDLKYDYKFVL